jgi:hypothetical protein
MAESKSNASVGKQIDEMAVVNRIGKDNLSTAIS